MLTDRNANRIGYQKTKVGWIPTDWSIREFRQLFVRAKKAINVSPEKYYREIGIRSHGKGIFHKDLIMGSHIGEKSVYSVQFPALVFNIVFAWEQAVAVTSLNENGLIASHRFPMYLQKENNISLHYYFYFFLTKRGKYLLEQASPGGAGRNKTLGQGDLSNLPIPQPSLFEQQKIATILSTWDKAIIQTRKLIGLKRHYKKGLIQQLLWGKRRFVKNHSTDEPQHYRFFDIPKDWKCPQLREIAIESTERNKNNRDIVVLSCSKHLGFVESAQYFGKKIFSDDTSNYKVIYRGFFGYPSNHIEEGSIGLLRDHDKGLVSPIYTVFKCNQEVVSEYLYAVFKSETFRHIFSVSTNSSVDRRGSLRWREFSLIRVPLPNIDEQKAIAKVLQTADKEINQLERKLNTLETQKRGLMQKLLTGEIRVLT